MALDEFSLIQRYFSGHDAGEGVLLGIGDDAALLQLPADESLVVTTDMLVAGRHFSESTAPFDIGWKSLAVNLSDLAAMGATPRWVTLALSLPSVDESWLAAFADGFFALARSADVALVGGDTTRGPLTISVTAMGSVPVGKALRRVGARAGDGIYVSGVPGEAALALQQVLTGLVCAPVLRARLDRPVPRVELGQALRGIASAALDVSDGLAQDLGHVLKRSGVGAELYLEALPQSADLARLADKERWALQLGGGDDYELCFTVPAEREAQVAALSDHLLLSRIGQVTEGSGIRYFHEGRSVVLDISGFNHFP